MLRRAWLPVLVAATMLAAVIPSTAAVGDADCTTRFTEPSTGHIDVSPGFPTVTGIDVGFALMPDGNSDAMIWDSVHFQVDGPAGHADVKAYDDRGSGRYTPAKEGHYTVSATWTRYDCSDIGRQTTTTGSAPAVGFDVVAGQRPKARFSTTKRRRTVFNHNGVHQVTPGDAALHVMAACPRDEVASHEPLTIDLYWTTDGRPATHSSRNVRTRAATGCYSSKTTRTKDFNSPKLNASASGEGAFIDVYEPLRVNVLAEVHSGSTLVGSKRAAFRRSSTGEGVKLG
ncbi:MAG: hypothetical protein QOH13_2089 [Thermoleophilaceae bacterium]|nr:hypothetical protein [Thermoleophilaceae bacterium]